MITPFHFNREEGTESTVSFVGHNESAYQFSLGKQYAYFVFTHVPATMVTLAPTIPGLSANFVDFPRFQRVLENLDSFSLIPWSHYPQTETPDDTGENWLIRGYACDSQGEVDQILAQFPRLEASPIGWKLTIADGNNVNLGLPSYLPNRNVTFRVTVASDQNTASYNKVTLTKGDGTNFPLVLPQTTFTNSYEFSYAPDINFGVLLNVANATGSTAHYSVSLNAYEGPAFTPISL